MRRRWLVAALSVALLLPASASAQSSSVVDLLDGVVLVGQHGETDDLDLTDAELVAATRRVSDLHAGIVTVDPASLAPGAEADELEAIVAATTARLADAGMIADRCLVTADQTAAKCIDDLFHADVLGMIVVGDFGDLTAAAEVPLRNHTIMVGIGDTQLGEGAVTLAANPITAATEQGKAAGRSISVIQRKRTGNALMVGAQKPRDDDPVRDAGETGLHQTAPAVKVTGRVGPAEVHTVDDLAPLLIGSKPYKVAIGEGLILDGVDAASLDTLPASLRLVTWTCSTPVVDLIDAATRIRGCVARADDAAGEAAANVILAIKTSRDVPAEIEIPVYIYRGTVPVGPGFVELGHRFTETPAPPTADETAAATSALTGRTVGVVVPVAPGSESEAQGQTRTNVEDAIKGLGALVTECVGRKAAAAACVKGLAADGVAAIVTIGTGADLTIPATAAVKAGIPVMGINELRLGDAGAVYVYVNPYRVSRLSGRMAGAYADSHWKNEPVDVVVLNDSGARADDGDASTMERALIQTDPGVGVMARLASKTKAQVASAVNTIVKRYASTRILAGQNAADAAPVLIKKRNVNPELVIYAVGCTPDIVAAIDAGVGTGGRLKGCVDKNAAGAGSLAGEVLTRLMGGATVPEINEVQVIPYEPGLH